MIDTIDPARSHVTTTETGETGPATIETDETDIGMIATMTCSPADETHGATHDTTIEIDGIVIEMMIAMVAPRVAAVRR